MRMRLPIFALMFTLLAAMAVMASVTHAQVRTAEQSPSGQGLWESEENFAGLLAALSGLRDHGLNPDDYGYDILESMQYMPREREELATQAWIEAAEHLAFGRAGRSEPGSDWRSKRKFIDLEERLFVALSTETVAQSLEALAPTGREYRLLLKELARLRAEPASASYTLPDGPMLRRGHSGSRVRILRARLAEMGYLDSDDGTDRFDKAVDQAVRRFQADLGLKPDGIFGPSSREVINLTSADKIDRVRVNLERLRWLPRDLGNRYVWVNIAGFDVTAFANGQPQRTHRVIVGRMDRQTPLFSDVIEYIVLNPWWETPTKLAREDELPLFREDPEAVERLGFHVLKHDGTPVEPETIDWHEVPEHPFPYRLRQAPGPQNALGEVKIMFPNRHNVYLHDTPGRHLFKKARRTFSSGCVRVQNVMDLVAWLLNDPERWRPEQIQEVVAQGEERVIRLKTRVPVHIVYQTAAASSDGAMRYLPDVYKRDNAILAMLGRTAPAQSVVQLQQ